MTDKSALREWIREHKVVWEIGPWRELVDHRPATVGFELDLFARHPPLAHPSPGCRDCMALHERLREIVLGAFPQGHRPSRYEIAPFDAALRLRPESEWAPEVQLTIRIIHGEGYLRPVDACERRCAEEIQRNLRALGVQPRSWSEQRSRGRNRPQGEFGVTGP